MPAYALKVTPQNHFINWQQDPSGNWLARLVFPEKTDELRIEVDLTAEMAVINPFDFFVEDYAQTRGFAYDPDLREELAPYLVPVDADGPEIEALLARLPAETNTVLFLVALNALIAGEIAYGVRMEPGVQTPAETLTLKSGSCRDSAWLLVQVLRRIGLAARFVSGYLIQLVPDTTAVDGPTGASRTSPTSMPGRRSTSPAPAGSAWTPPPACSRGRGTSRWPPRRITARPRRSPASRSPPRRPSTSR